MPARPLSESPEPFAAPEDGRVTPCPSAGRSPLVGRWLWRPRPVPRPLLPLDFERLGGFQRGVEALLYAIARLERWLSPGGGLRAWLRLNLLAGLALSASAVLVLPAARHVILELVDWTGMADTVAAHVSGAVLRLPPALVVLALTALGLAYWRRWQQRRHSDPRILSERAAYEDYR